MRLAPPPEQEEEPGQFWKDFIRETAPVFRKSTFEQLSEFIVPTWEALLDGARYVDDRLREIFDELQPDVIVEDNVCSFPAIPASGIPWVRIVSCNPLEVKDPDLPPTFCGLPAEDRSEWDAFRDEYRRAERRAVERLRRVLPRARRPGVCRRASSSTPRRCSTSMSIRARSITREASRWARRGTTSSRACGPPTRHGRCRPSSPTATGR